MKGGISKSQHDKHLGDAGESFMDEFAVHSQEKYKAVQDYGIPKRDATKTQQKLQEMAMAGVTNVKNPYPSPSSRFNPQFDQNDIIEDRAEVVGLISNDQQYRIPSRSMLYQQSRGYKRQYQNDWEKSWADDYDGPIPESILALCTSQECKVCGIQITSDVICQQHYEGAKHEKKVKLELKEVLKTDEVPAKRKREEIKDKVEEIKSENYCMNSLGESKVDIIKNLISSQWIDTLPEQVLSLCQISKCDVCDVSFSSSKVAESHYEGRKHKHKFEITLKEYCDLNECGMPSKAEQAGIPVSLTGELETMTRCSLCAVDLTSPAMAKIHFQGAKHRRKQQLASTNTGTPDETDTKSQSGKFGIGLGFYSAPQAQKPNQEKFDDDTPTPSITSSEEKDNAPTPKPTQAEGNAPPIFKKEFFCEDCNIYTTCEVSLQAHKAGKSHLKKINSSSSSSGLSGRFFCTTCAISTTDQNALDQHYKGKKHKSKLERAVSSQISEIRHA